MAVDCTGIPRMPSQAITVTDAPLVKPGDDVNVCIAICKAVPVASKIRIENSDTIVTLMNVNVRLPQLILSKLRRWPGV